MSTHRLKQLFCRVLFGAMFLAPMHSQAAVIYDNGGPDLSTSGGISEVDTSGSPIVADNFHLNVGANIITDIHWWGGYRLDEIVGDDFTAEIYSDSAGLPDALIHQINIGDVGRTFVGTNSNGKKVYEYSVDIAPITLTPDTEFWLSIFNSDGDITDNSSDWFWQFSMDPGVLNALRRTDVSGGAWQNLIFPREMAFNITGSSVPEPGIIALFGIGVIGIGFARRRKA